MQRKMPAPAMTMPALSASRFAAPASGGSSRGAEQQPRRRQGGAGQRQGLQAAGHFGTGGVQVGSGTFVQLQRSLPQPAVRVAAQPDRKQQQGRRDPYQHEQQLGHVVEREGKGQTARHAPGGQGDFPQFPLLVQKKPLRRFPADRAGGNFGNGGPGGLRRSGRIGSGAVGRILVEQIVHRHMKKFAHADDFLCFGVAAVTLPFADGLPGYIQSGGQFFLGHTRFLAQLLEFFAKRHGLLPPWGHHSIFQRSNATKIRLQRRNGRLQPLKKPENQGSGTSHHVQRRGMVRRGEGFVQDAQFFCRQAQVQRGGVVQRMLC